MQPIKITIHNFKTIKDIELSLVQYQDKTVLVSAENKDEEGSNSNKSGKTNFIKAVNWCIGGISFIDDSNDEVIRYGEKECFVSIEFDGGRKIERNLKGKTQNFYYSINSTQVAESNAECEEKWFQDAGINKVVVKTGIYLDSSSGTFLSMTPMERFTVFSQWFNLGKYDKATEVCRQNLKSAENEKSFIQSNLKEITDAEIKENKDTLDGLIVRKVKTETDLAELRKKQRAFVAQEALKLKAENISEQITVTEQLLSERQQAETIIKQNNKEGIKQKLDTITNSIAEINVATNSKKIEQTQLGIALNDIEEQLKKARTCPKCNTPFYIINNEVKLFDKDSLEAAHKDITNKREKLLAVIEKNNRALEEKNKEMWELEQLLLEVKQAEQVLSKEISDINKLKADHIELKQQLSDIEDYTYDIEELELSRSGDISNIALFEERIKNQTKQQEEYKNNLEKIKSFDEVIKLNELWGGKGQKKGLFSQIKGLILRKFLINLEILTNNNLKNLFEVDSGIKFEITDKGIELFQENGHRIGSCSSGEKARINFSLALAKNNLYPCNLEMLFIDEFFSNLDAIGMEYTLKILSKLKSMNFVISHVPVEHEHEIKLIKENNITFIEE